jgi:outer membrane protein assembly factor BamD (BamD/ComL family)
MRERTLLDMARNALARGDTGAALAAVEALEREAPNGQLAEEREVLAVEALVTANRTAEARRRAALFRMKYPTSPFLGVVEDAVSP